MGRPFEQRKEAEVPASPDEVWAAIATGPGIDSWFMGRTDVRPGAGGTVRTVMGEYAPELGVTAWDPARQFAYRSGKAPDGRFIAYEFLIEGRTGGSTVLRTVTSGFLPPRSPSSLTTTTSKGTPNMRKINAGLFVSLDGVVESPENWTGPYFNDQVGQAVGALMAGNDAMLLGRATYQGFAAAFGGQSGGMADQMNNTPKYVVSRTLTSADWQNSTLISGDVAGQIRELKQRPGRDIGMSGSSTLVSWLLRQGLLDRLDLLLFPVVIGDGKRLFSEPDGRVLLTLTGSASFSTGVVHLSYEPAVVTG